MYPTRLSVPTSTIPLTKGRQTPEDTEVEQDFKSRIQSLENARSDRGLQQQRYLHNSNIIVSTHVIFRQHPYAQHLLFIHQAWNTGHSSPVHHQHPMSSTCFTDLKDEGAEDQVQMGSGRIGPPSLRSPLGPPVLFAPYR